MRTSPACAAALLACLLSSCGPGASDEQAPASLPAVPQGAAPSDPAMIAVAASVAGQPELPTVLDEVLATATRAASEQELHALAAEIGGALVGWVPELRLVQIRFANEALDPAVHAHALANVAASPLVERSFPNTVIGTFALSTNGRYPDDGYAFDDATDDCACADAWDDPDIRNQVWGQWAVDLPGAWKRSTGSNDVNIAVVDTGFMPDHEDLGARADLRYGSATPPGHHGTHVAGIIGATGDNAIGVAGVNWTSDLRLYAIDAFQQHDGDLFACEGLTTLAISQVAILRALADGARVVNASIGYSWYRQVEECEIRIGNRRWSYERSRPVFPHDAASGPGHPTAAWLDEQKAAWRPVLDRCRDRGALLVVAAGNNSDPAVRLVDAKWSGGLQALRADFPDNIVVVASVGDPRDHRSYFGAWADQWWALSPFSSVGDLVDVAAPGASILSLVAYDQPGDDKVRYMSGTSMAAPFVTGLASLLLSLRPEMAPGDIKAKIVAAAGRAGPQVYRRLDPDTPEPVQVFPFHVVNAAETLRIIDRPAGCTDADQDGYGSREAGGGVGLACHKPNADCDDHDPASHPGAPEICDGTDNDCNGHTDEEDVCAGTLAAAPVSGVVPGLFTTDGGDFKVSVSPLDPHGDLIRAGLTPANFSFRHIAAELLDRPGHVVATGTAAVSDVDVLAGRNAADLALVLLFDSSGSMSDSDPSYLRVEAARQLLRLLAPTDGAALMDFGATGEDTPVTRLLTPLSHDQQAWEAGLQQITASGGTPLYAAVSEALDYLSAQASGGGTVVVLSDGQSTEPDPAAALHNAVALAGERAVSIFAVGLGNNLDFSGLETLATDTGATFAFAQDAQVLLGLFEALGVAATQGRVVVHGTGYFTPPLSTSGRHLVHGVLRTRVQGSQVDTPFSFTVLIESH